MFFGAYLVVFSDPPNTNGFIFYSSQTKLPKNVGTTQKSILRSFMQNRPVITHCYLFCIKKNLRFSGKFHSVLFFQTAVDWRHSGFLNENLKQNQFAWTFGWPHKSGWPKTCHLLQNTLCGAIKKMRRSPKKEHDIGLFASWDCASGSLNFKSETPTQGMSEKFQFTAMDMKKYWLSFRTNFFSD